VMDEGLVLKVLTSSDSIRIRKYEVEDQIDAAKVIGIMRL
jgi:hypothetical protein